jgi:hypothetical protein
MVDDEEAWHTPTDVFMANMLAGQSPREAWDEYERLLIRDAQLRKLVTMMAERPDTREMLDESRRVWRERGLSAPFDFLFDEEEKGRACA